MPLPIDLNQEAITLYLELLKKHAEDQYRGHEDYHLIKKGITPDGLVGGDITVKKKNPKDGTYRTVTYHVSVFDHLGYPLRGVEDIGGRCKKGEIAKTGHIFKCIRCHHLFCEKHIKFFDYNPEYALCDVGWRSCFSRYESIHNRSEELKLKTLIRRREEELAIATGDHVKARRYVQEEKYALEDLEDSRPGFFSSLFGLSLTSSAIRCPSCDWSPNSCDVTCQSCGHPFILRAGSPRRCPSCGTVVTEIHCIRCPNTIYT